MNLVKYLAMALYAHYTGDDYYDDDDDDVSQQDVIDCYSTHFGEIYVKWLPSRAEKVKFEGVEYPLSQHPDFVNGEGYYAELPQFYIVINRYKDPEFILKEGLHYTQFPSNSRVRALRNYGETIILDVVKAKRGEKIESQINLGSFTREFLAYDSKGKILKPNNEGHASAKKVFEILRRKDLGLSENDLWDVISLYSRTNQEVSMVGITEFYPTFISFAEA